MNATPWQSDVLLMNGVGGDKLYELIGKCIGIGHTKYNNYVFGYN